MRLILAYDLKTGHDYTVTSELKGIIELRNEDAGFTCFIENIEKHPESKVQYKINTGFNHGNSYEYIPEKGVFFYDSYWHKTSKCVVVNGDTIVRYEGKFCLWSKDVFKRKTNLDIELPGETSAPELDKWANEAANFEDEYDIESSHINYKFNVENDDMPF